MGFRFSLGSMRMDAYLQNIYFMKQLQDKERWFMFGALCVFVKTKTESIPDPYKNN